MDFSPLEGLAYLGLFVLGLFLYSHVKQLRYIRCPQCGVRIRLQAPRCPFCGEEFREEKEEDSKWSKPFYEP